MRFQVPQFIEVEDKIFGPLTFRQFIYLAGGVGATVIVYVLYGLLLAILIGLPVLGLSVALAFFKINERPFIDVFQSAIFFYSKGKLYLWKKQEKALVQKKVDVDPNAGKPFVPKLSNSKLKELAWSLDIKESLYSGENEVK